MRIKILLMAVILTGLLFSLSASAQITCICDNPIQADEECFSVPLQKNINTVINVPKFDSSLGCLQSVRITVTSCGYIWAEIDNEDNSPMDWEYNAISGVRVFLPDGLGETLAQFGTIDAPGLLHTGADDPSEGPEPFNPDYDGPDYARETFGTREIPICSEPELGNGIFVLDAVAAQLFSGSPSDTVPIQVTSSGRAALLEGQSPNVGFQSVSEMDAEVCVEYTYCPPRACIFGSKVGCDDEPLSGWTVTLTKPDGSTATNVTDADGQYSFCNLPAGSYDVCEETRPGWYPVGPDCYNDIILDGVDVYVPAFKNTEHFCISGYKYNVTNNAEDPLKDWKITLTKPDGSTVTDTTDDNGYYEFCDLANGQYKVSEELKTGWIAKSPASVNVVLYCEDEAVDFRNAKQPNLVCVCPFFIRNELYGASCKELKVVDASKGVISNDPPGSVVLNPESITIDPKYGTIEVNEDGSFVYDPTVATGRLYSGMYVMFKYNANNGLCDSVYPGIAKIQLRC